MNQIKIEFADLQDISEIDFKAFNICNSANSWIYKQQFYTLKNSILETYGHENGYDLQVIKKICHSCDGTGKFTSDWKVTEQCWNCDNGVYKTKKVVLKRYILNGDLFHVPIGEVIFGRLAIFDGYYDEYPCEPKFKYIDFDELIENTIDGIIKHESISEHPTYYFLYLLFKYDKIALYKLIESTIKNKSLHKKRKFDMKIKSIYLKYFAPKITTLDTDELPF